MKYTNRSIINQTSKVLIILFSLLFLFKPFPLFASQGDETYTAITSQNINVPVSELELALLPLLKDEIEIEVKAWLVIVKNKATILSEAEILVSQKKEGVEALTNLADASSDAVEIVTSTDATNDSVNEIKLEVKEDLNQLEALSKKLNNEKANKAIASLESKQNNLSALSEQANDFAVKLQEKRKTLIASLTQLREEKNAVLERFNIVLSHWESKGGEASDLKLYAKALQTTNVDLSDGNATWLTFKGWLNSKEGGQLWLSNIIKFIFSLFIVYLIAMFFGGITDAALNRNKKISFLLKNFIQVMVRRIILSIGFLMSLTIIGINVAPVLALIGAAGLVIGLALQSTLSNFASGMLILIYRPFDVGEVIEIDGVVGTVDSMTLLSTAIKTFDNQHLILPNNNVWGTTIINVTGSETRRVDLVFGIGYRDDLSKAQAILEEIVEQHAKVLEAPKAIIKVHELADSSVNFVCRPWVKTIDYWDVYWDITREVKEQFDKQGVGIPFPQQDIHLHHVKSD
ncbi:mechanosensitive ion channel domain-containing protein [Colwellia sp. RSH04]|uniref:mechanosensitive ion channel domain-containing protein n=1 Tax=Colwellia sp. RSH04 TaxID=2305464 RepID=UPI000E56C158|nr:mechanosensitive ion channel domain-containing protein [Colwellia sp. RSH04]RHW75340.1 mechanosensitive ion channel family protein [Colwellia sp. RSH04]